MGSIVVVLPAYNAERTLAKTIETLPKVYHAILLCDDASSDRTVEVARGLELTVFEHEHNGGYGANQKTLYREALQLDPDVIVMVHPDNQYDASNLAMGIAMIREHKADFVLGNRMSTARTDGMPLWRYLSNRFLTLFQNLVFRAHLHEFHSGLRLYRTSLLRAMPFEGFSNDFVFDSETIAWAFAHGYRFGEISARCHYGFNESSINFKRSITYGIATLRVLVLYMYGYYRRLQK